MFSQNEQVFVINHIHSYATVLVNRFEFDGKSYWVGKIDNHFTIDLEVDMYTKETLPDVLIPAIQKRYLKTNSDYLSIWIGIYKFIFGDDSFEIDAFQRWRQDIYVKSYEDYPEKPRGLYSKYSVYNEEGLPVDGCFVLRPKKDNAAREALRVYSVEVENVLLYNDIRKWLETLENEFPIQD